MRRITAIAAALVVAATVAILTRSLTSGDPAGAAPAKLAAVTAHGPNFARYVLGDPAAVHASGLLDDPRPTCLAAVAGWTKYKGRPLVEVRFARTAMLDVMLLLANGDNPDQTVEGGSVSNSLNEVYLQFPKVDPASVRKVMVYSRDEGPDAVVEACNAPRL